MVAGKNVSLTKRICLQVSNNSPLVEEYPFFLSLNLAQLLDLWSSNFHPYENQDTYT